MNILKTDRLIIRLATLGDEEAIYSYRSNYIENKYQGWLPGSVEEVSDYIKNMPLTLDSVDICYQFAIILKEENRLIGDMGIVFTGYQGMQADLGYTLNKDFQGKGYATEALSQMVDFLFLSLNKHRLTASIDPRNIASIRLIERLGFRKEAYFKESYYLRGEWTDDVVYAMLRKEWINKNR